MRQGTVLALVGGAVFVAVGLATLPASLLTPRLPPDLRLEGVAGSVWNGAARGFAWRGVPLGELYWRIRPGALFRGRLDYAIDLRHPQGHVRGDVGVGLGGTLVASDLDLRLPLTTLSPATAANAWQGELAGTVVSARVEGGWPVSADGRFTIADLRPPGATQSIGDYALDVDPSQTTADRLVGRLRDLDAPLVVRAQLVIRRDRTYTLEGEVTPKPGAPTEVANTVAFLGVPDAAGRRPFAINGSF